MKALESPTDTLVDSDATKVLKLVEESAIETEPVSEVIVESTVLVYSEMLTEPVSEVGIVTNTELVSAIEILPVSVVATVLKSA